MRSYPKVAWRAKTLGEVCKLVSGQHIEAKDYNTESRGIGYLTGPSDFGVVHPVVSKWTEHPKVNAIRGDILITVKGSGVGKINLLDQEEVAISRQLMAVRVTGADPGFVYAFLSPEWDGEPVEPEPSEPKVPKPYGPDEPAPNPKMADGSESKPRPTRIKVKLADGKARTIQHMMCTTFWHPGGTPMSAQQFMELLFGKLPDFFKNEAELRALWSAPDTRKRLLEGLAEKGFGKDQLTEMQKIIDAEKSDLFDVLAHVAYALAPLTRAERAQHAKVAINHAFNSKQQTLSLIHI